MKHRHSIDWSPGTLPIKPSKGKSPMELLDDVEEMLRMQSHRERSHRERMYAILTKGEV